MPKLYTFLPAFCLFLLLCLASTATAQDAVKWYTGRGSQSIDFSSEPPIIKERTGGNLGYREVAILYNRQGRPLLYSFGDNVYDSSLNPVDTLRRMNINPWRFRTKMHMVPGSDHQAWIIYQGLNSQGDLGTHLLLVDVSQLPNMPNLDEVLVLDQIGPMDVLPDEEGLWVVIAESGLNDDRLAAYLVSHQGLIKEAELSIEIISVGYERIMSDLYFSNKGEKLAFVDGHKIKLFTFDHQTGTLVIEKVLDEFSPMVHDHNTVDTFFGPGYAAFSPNDSFLYVVVNGDNYGNISVVDADDSVSSGLLQYDLYPSDDDERVIRLDSTRYYSGIAVGPNRKLYLVTYDKVVDVLKYPDRKGETADLVRNGKSEPFRPTSFYTYPVLPNNHNNQWPHFRHQYFGCDSVHFINISDPLFREFRWFVEPLDAPGPEQTYDGRHYRMHLPEPGRYYVRLRATSREGYTAWYSDTLLLQSPPRPQLSLTLPDTACLHLPMPFNASIQNDTLHPVKPETFHWLFGDGEKGEESQVEHVYTQPGTYTATATYSNGFCTVQESQEVVVPALEEAACSEYLPRLWVPTAFSPNGDGLNDTLQVVSTGMQELELRVYNEWGELIYRGEGHRGWDGMLGGKLAPAGTYLYLVEGTALAGNKERAQGQVTLVR